MLQCNCSIIGDPVTREALVVDPGDEVSRILDLIGRHKLTVKAIVSTHALHEIYLPAFWAATNIAKASSVMCACSTINGQAACQNQYLMKRTLDQRWGFPGFVTSDYQATHSTVQSADAGMDQEMLRRSSTARPCSPRWRTARSAWPC